MDKINELIDLAFIGTVNNEDFDAQCFKIHYCNPKISFNITPMSFPIVLGAYPKDNKGRNSVKKYLNSMKYTDFLQTTYWKSIAEWVKSVHNYRCANCNGWRALATHHKTYDHKGEEILYLDDLTCLCLVCHDKFHGK